MAAAFEHFVEELNRLCTRFEQGSAGFLAPDYSEARLRADFLDPFFRALGWDLENRAGLVQSRREVEIESRTDMAGRAKRADYLFRTDGVDRFICEAKKPAEELRRHAFQAKRYAWNKGVVIGVLSDFEGLHVFIVGHKPHPDEPDAGRWREWTFRQYPEAAREIWDLLSREAIAGGSIDKLIDSLPKKKSAGKGKARQQWLIKPDRTRALDADFLNFLDEARQGLGTDLLQQNDRADLLADNRLNEAVQRILDRLLFLRICEDRDIDTGRPLAHILRNWREYAANPPPRRVREKGLWAGDDAGAFVATSPRPAWTPLWREIVAHFKALDRRPPSHIPFFNGNLFKEHFSETLHVGDEWLAGFLDQVSDEESPYLFNVIPVEILGTIYERFLGKVVRPQGRGTTVEEKPEVRKAGGVYYTPRYIVDYIVEQTIGKLLEDRTPEKSLELKILDPACGSGSFLIRAFERVCEHWQEDFKKHPSKRKRPLCWVDETTGDVHLTTDLKRRILTHNIYGVDLDAGAVEVTQLSLYLKMLEGETRHTLAAERDLFGNDIALLPPLQNNIKCGNSLIASDFSLDPDELVRVRAFDWDVQFREIMKAGGFDAVVGNPPYGASVQPNESEYLRAAYEVAGREVDTYALFMEKCVRIAREGALTAMIVPTGWYSGARYPLLRSYLAQNCDPEVFVNLPYDIFADAWVDTTIYVVKKRGQLASWPRTEKHQVVIKTFPKKHKIISASEFYAETKSADFAEWFLENDDIYLTYADSASTNLLRKLFKKSKPFSDYADIQRGVTPFELTDVPAHVNSRAAFNGTVRRYYSEKGDDKYIRFDDTLAEPKPARYFEGPRLLIRELVSRQFQIQATKVEDGFVTNKSMQSALSLPGGPSLSFMLGCFNSRLMSWCFLKKSNIAQRDDFPKIVLKETRSLPFPIIKLSDPADRARHDKLVELVDKMLMLVPKLRAETNEAKKKTLQNAVDATDRQIDRLVYELYGLTEEEIALVEGEAET